ncbi:MAG: glutamate--tRNA ligase [Candidatus Methanomethylicus sp.]|nr:glutamate--tRNA ligase [Candidatus Methanomethylicus sp.]
MGENDHLRNLLRNYALVNALKYGGKANPKAVAGMALSEDASLKSMASEIFRIADEVVRDVNVMSPDDQKATASSLNLIVMEKPKVIEHILPKLPNADKYSRIKVRFAPNPDSVIHLGNTRAAILSDEYAKMYKGLFVLRFEDTSPSVKPPEPEAYEVIKTDLKWLGINWDEEYTQSDRLPIYYEHAERLIALGGAYICNCPSDAFRNLIAVKKPCPCRELPVEEHFKRWKAMLSGKIKRGEAVMRIKTDIGHPNPAIRDWPAMRIDTKPHPRLGTKFRVWPLYNFAAGIDDHLMGITHILRGKEHEVNMIRQKYMYRYFGWTYPEAIHYGRLKIEGTVLSKSKIRQGIIDGVYKDWSDPRLGTIAALRKRGFLPETMRKLILEVGVRPSEAMISWENLESINRKMLDPISKRFIFILNPVRFEITGIEKDFLAQIPLHPDHPEWGVKPFTVGPQKNSIMIPSRDAASFNEGSVFRMMNLFNVKVTGVGKGRFLSEDVADARRRDAHIIQWLPDETCTELSIIKPDAKIESGVVDPAVPNENLPATFQFYRYGFVRVYYEDGKILGYFTHG